MDNIGENIRKLRAEHGWTQGELAKVSGVGENYISAIERGDRNPGKKIVAKFAEAFGVTKRDVMFGAECESVDPDLQFLQEEVKKLFEAVKADSPLKKHHFMTEMLGKLKALGDEGQE